VRDDDPNDVIPHQHRRELRGARLFAAWLNHFDAREQNSMNTWMAENSEDPDSTPGHIRHWYLDFGDCFGSQWDWDMISRRLGHAHYLDFGYVSADFLTLGAIERPWDRAQLNDEARIFGYFSARDFEPEAWRGGYPNPAFAEMSELDGAWAARIIARFTPRLIETAVRAGDLTNPAHTRFLIAALTARRASILERYLTRLSPLTNASIEGNRLCATDVARASGVFAPAKFRYGARLYAGERLSPLASPALSADAESKVCVELPRAPASARSSLERFLIVDLGNGLAPGPLRAHVYDRGAAGFELAGVERPETSEAPEF
jgi:hypothetical protein